MRLFIISSLLALFGALGMQAQVATSCFGVSGASYPCSLTAYIIDAQVNAVASSGSGTTLTHAFTNQQSKGNTNLCIGFESAAAAPTFTDADSNTYVVANSSATAPGITVAVATNIKGLSTNTVTETVTSGAASFVCHELAGTLPVGQVWSALNVQQGTGTVINFPTVAVRTPGEVLFAAVGMGGGTINATPAFGNSVTGLTTVDANNTSVTGGAALSDFYAAHANLDFPLLLTQSLSPSASETYSAVLVGIKPPYMNGITSDPCASSLKQSVLINTTSSATLITGASGQQVFVCEGDVTTPSNQTIAFVEGTGTLCATGIAGLDGGTTAATGFQFASTSATNGIVEGNGAGTIMFTKTPGDNVCVLLSGSSQASGKLIYVSQ